jgi:tetratricopeptide (TPR) repeat protein
VAVLSVDAVRRFVVELARRRVFQVVAIYGGASFAFLQGADIVIEALSLPPGLLTTLTVLVLAGFGVALVVGWIYDLDAAGRLHRTGVAGAAEGAEPVSEPESVGASADATRASWPVRLAGLGVVVLVGSAGWFVAARVSPPGDAYAVSDPLGSYLVVPIRARGQSEADLALADRAAGRLMWKLRGWDAVRVVQEVALSGMLYELGIGPGSAPSLDQAFGMARSRLVGTVVGLSVTTDADSARLEAVLYDVGRQSEISQTHLVSAPVDDLDGLVAPVARAILQVRDLDVGIDELRMESPVLTAHQDFSRGLAALYGWRLDEAEAEFREAVRADSLFAAAYHYLALSLYWQTSRDGELVLENGPEIARLTQAASRLAAVRELRPGLRDHVEAFRAFWAGDYDRARNGYDSLLQRDPSDTEAWLLLGAVEYTDPYLERDDDGSLWPRGDVNLARHAFERAIELSPDLQFSYGHLFALDRDLLEPAILGEGCPAFELPDAPRLPPYAPREAGTQPAYCPVPADSVAWVPQAVFDDLDLSATHEWTRRAMRRSRGLLENWVQIHPDQPRPHEELDRWLAWQRSLLSCAADAAETTELTRAILVHRTAALALRGDTTPADRSRLALLLLADGQVEAARQVFGGFDSTAGPPPIIAANVYMAFGRTDEAIGAAAPANATSSWAFRDPVDGTIVSAGNVGSLVGAIRIRGATGDGGKELRSALEALLTRWSIPPYTARQSALLRRMMLRFGVMSGLMLERDLWPEWFAGWTDTGLDVPVLWQGLLATADPASSANHRVVEALDLAIDSIRLVNRPTAQDHYALGVLARDAGRDSIAVGQFRRVEACPLPLEDPDSGWGLRTLSRLYLARALEAIGDTTGAARTMDEFDVLWGGSKEPVDQMRR